MYNPVYVKQKNDQVNVYDIEILIADQYHYCNWDKCEMIYLQNFKQAEMQTLWFALM